jgi:predicted Fe-Mo cluster-binding NifX family protein
MKIAVASIGNTVCAHFGHCENFQVFEEQGGCIANAETILNPGHRPGFLPNFLGDMNVDVIIAGGMGGGAVEIFNERNIEVIVGADGDARRAAERYLAGELKSTGSVCHSHEHSGDCGNH